MKGNVRTAGLLSLVCGIICLLCTGVMTAVIPEQVFGWVGSALCDDGAVFSFSRIQASGHRPGQFHPSAVCIQGGVQEDVTGQAIGVLLGGGTLCPATALFLPIFILLTVFRRRRGSDHATPPEPSQQQPGTTVHRQHSITVNGQSYDRIEDLPPAVRTNLKQVAHLLPQGFMQGDAAAPPPGPSRTIAQRLQDLQNLFDLGLIDSREYEAKKSEILQDL